ncbi:MAG TPA: hypothetical protein VM223_27210 [Planctomycetota bacterium]|nr:hypothetical protein [Planctomycetota bacterium]
MYSQEQELRIVISGVGAENVQRALDNLERQGAKAQTTITGFGAKGVLQFNLFNRAVDLGVRAVGALGRELGDAVVKGMDAAETISLINTSMGEHVDALHAWSEGATATLVNTRLEVERQATTYYNMAKGMKLGEEAAFELATGMANLTADVASFHNLHPEEAFIKLSSAMTGEYEAMKSLGVVLKASTVDHEALAMSGKSSAKELSEADRVAARYKLVMEGLGPAVGDVERTSGSLTNTMRGLVARYTELQEEIGLVLAQSPELQTALAGINRITGDVVQSVRDWIAANPELVKQLTGSLAQGIITFTQAVSTAIFYIADLSLMMQYAGHASEKFAADLWGHEEEAAKHAKSMQDIWNLSYDLKQGYDEMSGSLRILKGEIKAIGEANVETASPSTRTVTKDVEDLGAAADATAKKVAGLGGNLKETAGWAGLFHGDDKLTGKGFGSIFDKAFGDFPGTRQADRGGQVTGDYDDGGGSYSYAAASASASASIGGGGGFRLLRGAMQPRQIPSAPGYDPGGSARGQFGLPFGSGMFENTFRTGGFGTGTPGSAGNPIHVKVSGSSMDLAEELVA